MRTEHPHYLTVGSSRYVDVPSLIVATCLVAMVTASFIVAGVAKTWFLAALVPVLIVAVGVQVRPRRKAR